MSEDTVACKSCGGLFLRRLADRHDECPNCEHRGRTVEYVDGNESRRNWFKRVELGALA